jgi:hypothetical protein
MKVSKKFRALWKVCSKDEERPGLLHIKIFSKGILKNKAVATDGIKLAVVPVEEVNPYEEGCLVYSEFWKRAMAAGGPGGYTAHVTFKSKKHTFEVCDGIYANAKEIWRQDSKRFTILPEGTESPTMYPDADKVLPELTPRHTKITLNPRALLDIAEALGVQEYEAVTLAIGDGRDPIVIIPTNTRDTGAYGLLMPAITPDGVFNEYPLGSL